MVWSFRRSRKARVEFACVSVALIQSFRALFLLCLYCRQGAAKYLKGGNDLKRLLSLQPKNREARALLAKLEEQRIKQSKVKAEAEEKR